jgi:outer membrane protein TolC
MRRAQAAPASQAIAAIAAALVAGRALAQQAPAAAPPGAVPGSAVSAANESQALDLATVLRLAGLNDLDLALVRAAQAQAMAANDAALLQFFPWLEAGGSYYKHSGAATELGVLEEESSQLTTRGGTLNQQLAIGDAVFAKLAAGQRVRAAGFDLEAARNNTSLAAAAAYFDLVNAVAAADIARDAVRISQEYEEQLDRAYQAGLVNRSEVLRVSVQTQRGRVVLRQAEASVRSAAATLATLLRLDPAVELLPAERIVNPPTLIEVDTPVNTLVREALAFRPELKSGEALVAAQEQVRIAATYGPLIPSLVLQAGVNELRGGQDDVLRGYSTTHDYTIGLNWRIGPGGLLDFSRTEAAGAALLTARLNAQKLHDAIAGQVVQAYEAARAALDQMGLSRHGIELAEQSLKLSQQRRELGVYAVLEVIQAQQDLTQARAEYAQALTGYAKAQYALAHATARIGGR